MSVSPTCIYDYVFTGFEKKTRTRVQVKDIKIRLLKNLFIRFISKYLYFAKQNKTPEPRKTESHVVETCRNLVN